MKHGLGSNNYKCVRLYKMNGDSSRLHLRRISLRARARARAFLCQEEPCQGRSMVLLLVISFAEGICTRALNIGRSAVLSLPRPARFMAAVKHHQRSRGRGRGRDDPHRS